MENLETDKVTSDLRQSIEYAKYMERIGWKIITIHSQSGGNLQLFLKVVGPLRIAKIQRTTSEIDWNELEDVLDDYHVLMCKFEPGKLNSANSKEQLRKNGFKQDNWPLLASRTLRVDISHDEKDVFESFKKDSRYCLRKALELKIQPELNNFDLFYGIWKKAAAKKKLWIPPVADYKSIYESFGSKCFCITLRDLSGCLVLIHDRTAYYYYSGSLEDAKKFNLPYQIIWEGIKEAKKRKCTKWDFEGIYDGRWPNKGWLGFSHFKHSFGGEEIEFPGSFVKWRCPL